MNPTDCDSCSDDETQLRIWKTIKTPPDRKKPLQKRLLSLRLTENRIMSKRGRVNIYKSKLPEKSKRYARDLWHTLISMRWRWIMLTVALVNVTAYLTFAAFFLFDAWFSGDFNPEQDHQTCIKGTNDLTSFFMLGIETITTTGYGYFYPTEYCKLGWVVLTFSTLVTIFIDGAFTSVVYVKISRPPSKMTESIFSRKAVITMRNGELCFIFRLNDKNGKHWINTNLSVILVRDSISNEFEVIPNYMEELKLEHFGENFWPIDVVHVITAESPLWDISAQDLITTKFEILAEVSGSSIVTGNASKNQTSYSSKEILWGYRFAPCIEYNSSKDEYVVNKKHFNKTVPHDTPLCSARKLTELQGLLKQKRNSLQ